MLTELTFAINHQNFDRYPILQSIYSTRETDIPREIQRRRSVNNPDHIWGRACACHTGKAPVAKSPTRVGSSLLDSSKLLLFRQPITSPIIVFTSGPTCLQSFKWPWKMNYFFSIGHQLRATSNPAISTCLLLWLRNDFSIPRAPDNMSHKKPYYNLFQHLDVIQPYPLNN